MDLTRLRHIAAVGRNGSFSRAAEEEGITQPALSRSIAAFEQRYGVKLFDRGRGGVYPTAAGLLVIEHAQKLLSSASDLERNLDNFPSGQVGRLAFGLGPLLASLFLPTLGAALLRDHPGLHINTVIRPPTQLVAELLADQIEAIIGNNWNLGRVPGTEIERLGRIEVAIIMRVGHPLAGIGNVTAAMLEGYPTASAIELPNVGMRGGVGSFICDNFHILRELVLQSDCVCISSPKFHAEDLRDGKVVLLPVVDIPPMQTEICLVFKRTRSQSPFVLALASHVKEMIGAMCADSREVDA